MTLDLDEETNNLVASKIQEKVREQSTGPSAVYPKSAPSKVVRLSNMFGPKISVSQP